MRTFTEGQEAVLSLLRDGEWWTARQLTDSTGRTLDNVRRVLESLYTKGVVWREEIRPPLGRRWAWRVLNYRERRTA